MPVNAYVGLPRAGKTYEVVVLMLAALRQGRRVVSNIAGLNYEAMCQVLFREGVAQEQIGELVHVTNAQVEEPTFWRTDEDDKRGVVSLIQPGDFVALDEIWRFCKRRGDVHPRMMNFMRMHGHMAHPVTGYTCEVALITQSVRDINENVRAVVQETYQAVKNTKLGSSKSYIVHVYQQGSTSKADYIRTLPPRRYNPDYFPCYNSHSVRQAGGAAAREENPDKRANVLRGPFFVIGLPLLVVVFGFSVWELKRFFRGPSHPPASSSAPVAASGVPQAVPALSRQWRVVGAVSLPEGQAVMLTDGVGAVRYVQVHRVWYMLGQYEVELPEGGRAVSWNSVKSEGKK